MEDAVQTSGPVRFGVFELDLRTGELRKNGLKLKLGGQPLQVLAILVEHRGGVVTREELQEKIWPDTFVDFEHNLNTAIKKIRDVLGDSAENPRFVETLPRRGYRFIAPVESQRPDAVSNEGASTLSPRLSNRWRMLFYLAGAAAVAVLASLALVLHRRHVPPIERALTRITFGNGLEQEPTWSPDGQLMAYASDHGGKLDIWVQQVNGGEPVQVTHAPGNNWQPSWSPDGKYIAYRSEAGAGLFIIPALGSDGPGRRITSFGYRPQWSPDGNRILFQTLTGLSTPRDTYYLVSLDGGQPQVVLDAFVSRHLGSMAWYPNGERVSLWEKQWNLATSSPNLWTISLRDGKATRWEIAPELAQQFEVISGGNQTCDVGDSFAWAPSGDAVFFACEYRGATNIWKMTLDTKTMRATGVERLTAGAGPDENPAVSPDGKRLAYSAKSKRVRVWLLPFDANSGRVLGKASPVTSSGSLAYEPALSPDGRKLAFSVLRSRRIEIWEKLLPDGHEGELISGDYDFGYPQWSHDGKKLVYRAVRAKSGTASWQFGLWSEDTRTEQPLTGTQSFGAPFDWWPDDKSILVSSYHPADNSADIQRLWLDKAPHADESATTLASRPGYSLWQAHVSPDGKRIVFMGLGPGSGNKQSAIYVIPAEGGDWLAITGDNHWADKPRWSPDGNLIYYVIEKDGFLNVWGIRFNTTTGKAVGAPFQITRFESPGLMLPSLIEASDISLSRDKLVLDLQETSGSVWMLDNVDQ
ncbi:MAG TPA: winged helix-turn-helix domain-containing protein [Terriglobales bacterium]|nr:winged helix-turn-helix domain-containing protein [Terriglobales bacterium]